MQSHFQQFAATVSQSLIGSLLSLGLSLTKQDSAAALILLRTQRK
jgi:hypothetical protein